MRSNGRKPQSKYTFAIIKHYNSPNEATTKDGIKVRRSEKIYLPTLGKEFPVAQYDNHFIFADPMIDKIKGRWSPMCTCGYMAGVVNYDAYKLDASYQGSMVVCLAHAQRGKHADGTT